MNANYIKVLAEAVKTAIKERNAENVKSVFENLKSYKAENPEEATDIQKAFNSELTKLEVATAKQLGKTNSSSSRAGEIAKNEFETLTQSTEVQRKKVKNMLSGYINTDRKVFSAKYTKSEILTRYDAMTDEEFLGLYRGASITPNVAYGAIVAMLDKDNKGAK